MKFILKLWVIIFVVGLIWLYFIFLSPKIFNNSALIIPDVVNLDEPNAIKKLEDNHIRYKITYIENDKELAIKTIPYAGTKIKSDFEIDLYIGKIFPVSYSSFLGRLYDDVSNQIERLCIDFDLKLNISYEIKNDMISGVIIKESLIEGEAIEYGEELNITISKNDSTYFMPKFLGLTVEEAIKLSEEYNINLNLIYIETPLDSDIVIFQSTEENTLIQRSNQYQLDLYISKGIKETTIINTNTLLTILDNLGYVYEINFLKSNDLENKLVAFKVQKLYDIGITKYILWITE